MSLVPYQPGYWNWRWWWPLFPYWTPNRTIRGNVPCWTDLWTPAWEKHDIRGQWGDRDWVTYTYPSQAAIEAAEQLFPGRGVSPPWGEIAYELQEVLPWEKIETLKCWEALETLTRYQKIKARQRQETINIFIETLKTLPNVCAQNLAFSNAMPAQTPVPAPAAASAPAESLEEASLEAEQPAAPVETPAAELPPTESVSAEPAPAAPDRPAEVTAPPVQPEPSAPTGQEVSPSTQPKISAPPRWTLPEKMPKWVTSSDVAEAIGLEDTSAKERLRKRLDRWRPDHDKDYRNLENAPGGTEQYTYRWTAIKGLVEEFLKDLERQKRPIQPKSGSSKTSVSVRNASAARPRSGEADNVTSEII